MVYCRQALRSLGMILSEYLFGVSGSSELIALMLATVAFLHSAPILALMHQRSSSMPCLVCHAPFAATWYPAMMDPVGPMRSRRGQQMRRS